jgi:hypothetical protein
MPPYQGGGEMISSVSFEKTTYNVLPFKFEAGTPDYIGSTITVIPGLTSALLVPSIAIILLFKCWCNNKYFYLSHNE